MRKIAKIRIDDKFLLNWLQFPFGRIIGVQRDPNIADTTEILIEDNEMPKVRDGDHIPCIMLTVTCYQDCEGHKVCIRNPIKEGL